MVLHLETAAALEARAQRSSDAVQVAVLLRRAEQRRRQAARIREELAAGGAALAAPQPERLPAPRPGLGTTSAGGGSRRS
jgi:hypothetical protein